LRSNQREAEVEIVPAVEGQASIEGKERPLKNRRRDVQSDQWRLSTHTREGWRLNLEHQKQVLDRSLVDPFANFLAECVRVLEVERRRTTVRLSLDLRSWVVS